MNNNFLTKNKKIIYYMFFIIFLILNFILLLKHEPWRDEIHAWLMSKVYSVPDLFVASNFDGHPILWHLILMPFAKLNFPIITLNIISFIIVSISAWILLFKTNFPLFFKVIVLFTIPFTYTYSAISRNYSLILFLLMIIGVFYPKRFEKPLLYSFLISLLIHTHSLVWGIVAGLTITFHFIEIYKYFKYKNVKNIKEIILGLILIVINTIIVVLELYGTTNSDYGHAINSYIIYIVKIIIIILFSFLISTILTKKGWKEFAVLCLGLGFQILIYTCFYSSVLYQRLILIFVIVLFYLLILSFSKIEKNKLNIICIIYLIAIFLWGIKPFFQNVVKDFKYNYSSAKEIAQYINNNLPENSTVLIDASIIGQSIIPYLNNTKLYDIAYNNYVDCANVSYNTQKIYSAVDNINKYSGKFIIICNNIVTLDSQYANLIYETQDSIINEHFSLYFIK